MAEDEVVMPDGTTKEWVVYLDGNVWREGSLTLQECEEIETLAQTFWTFISPVRSAKQCRILLQVLLHTRAGLDLDAALERVNKLTIKELFDTVLKVEDVSSVNDLPTEFTDGFPPAAVG